MVFTASTFLPMLIARRFYFLLMFLQDEEEVPWLLEYITCLLSLAVFGILGVIHGTF